MGYGRIARPAQLAMAWEDGMSSGAWNVSKVAAIGAVVGLVYAMGKAAIGHPGAPLEYYGGTIVGGVIGGAVLFGLAALVRNLFVRSRP